MRKLLTLAWLTLFLIPGVVSADKSVRGYVKKDGTYVAPYYQSSPDSSYNNNWSVKPNYNPYTGERGSLKPTNDDRPPSNNNGYGGYKLRSR